VYVHRACSLIVAAQYDLAIVSRNQCAQYRLPAVVVGSNYDGLFEAETCWV
jgi:hypothetical protein